MARSAPPRPTLGRDARGITLLELLVAMLILAMVSTMLYSVLNVGIGFSRKGEAKTLQLGRERALLELLHRQVQGAWYDKKQKKILLYGDENQLRLVTSAPLLHRDLGQVMAIYLYDAHDDTLYYTEKKDFYNTDYQESYQEDRKEMLVLLKGSGPLRLEYQSDKGVLGVTFRGKNYTLPIRCWMPEAGG